MKNLLNLGKALNKAEQLTINGGKRICDANDPCPNNACCYIRPGCSVGFCDARLLC